ncbi:hypothetical protein CRD60_04650 [Bifidobacterium aemilianum]|uniref:CobQ/CobB/MinD/ParA nucleotide binding domain-containing protein n=1 Tax=Bifidobacterium aemilianum TaxID=2493120 RepID=A0A366K982_9BIFI|nr:ParA family protein [Bifidobacterium aemilianum]RBP97877.1 hypothetical protein CRD60_04650 [Bifidobacterium aemilianum]
MRIGLVNFKGGVAKTTSSIYLAAAACVRDLEVTVHDLDPHAEATKWARISRQLGHPLPFPVLAANGETLEDLADDRKLHILDAAPSGPGLESAIAHADLVIVPTSESAADVQQTWMALDTLKSRGVPAWVLMCRAEPRTRSFREAIGALDSRGVPRFDTVIGKSQALKHGPAVDLGIGASRSPRLAGYGQVLAELGEEGLL